MLFGLIGGGAGRITDTQYSRTTLDGAAVVTIAAPTAGSKARNIIHRVIWSYSDNPTGGRLTIVSGATTFLDIDITVGGPGSLALNIAGLVDTSVVATLADPGGTIVGKLHLEYTIDRG